MVETSSLIRRILAGDREAFKIIVEKHQRLVSHVVFRMVSNKFDREDLCQDIFIKVFMNLSSFQFGSKLSSWIAKIAYNTCIDFLKKYKNHLSRLIPFENTSLENLTEGNPPPDGFTQRGEIRLGLQKEIEKIPPNFRAILTLYHLEGMSYKEISEIMQLPEGTVKSYLFRARRLLRKRLISKYQKENL